LRIKILVALNTSKKNPVPMVPAVPREEPVPNVSAVPVVPIVLRHETNSDNVSNVNTATLSEDIRLESVKKAKALVLAQLGFRPRPSNGIRSGFRTAFI
jgi:hypothetical protein